MKSLSIVLIFSELTDQWCFFPCIAVSKGRGAFMTEESEVKDGRVVRAGV